MPEDVETREFSDEEWSSLQGLVNDTPERLPILGFRGSEVLDPAFGLQLKVSIDGEPRAAKVGRALVDVDRNFRVSLAAVDALGQPDAHGIRSLALPSFEDVGLVVSGVELGSIRFWLRAPHSQNLSTEVNVVKVFYYLMKITGVIFLHHDDSPQIQMPPPPAAIVTQDRVDYHVSFQWKVGDSIFSADLGSPVVEPSPANQPEGEPGG